MAIISLAAMFLHPLPPSITRSRMSAGSRFAYKSSSILTENDRNAALFSF